MKSRYLDLRNCHQLLPSGNGLPLIQQLDNCLEGINNQQNPLKGSIDLLIKQNEKTLNQNIGSKRLCNSPVEIAQGLFIRDRSINTQAEQRNFPGSAQLHTLFHFENGMTYKTIVPLQYLLKGWGDAGKGHQCYIHSISPNITGNGNIFDAESYYYVGITGRNWLLRLEEHIREMRQGNRRRFYEVWRDLFGKPDVIFIAYLENINLSFKEAMDWEEKYVDKLASDQYGLNMIPGGFKGLKFLHVHRFINSMDISLEEREKAIAEYIIKNPRKGIPNPFIADLWKDDDFYIKNIEAKEKTLTPEQVRKIRELNQSGIPIEQIVREVDALNELQVKNVIQGRYYSRMK
jgi:hypothetical protein